MRNRILLVVAMALSLVVVPAAGAQAAERTRDLSGSLRMAMIQQTATGAVFAGELRGTPMRRSGLVLRNAVAGSTSTGRAVVYAKRGTIRATVVNEIQPQADGSVNLPGTFRITGGTGRFRGATGSGSFEAHLPAGSTVYEATLDGKIRY
jgi:hypothetical protein